MATEIEHNDTTIDANKAEHLDAADVLPIESDADDCVCRSNARGPDSIGESHIQPPHGYCGEPDCKRLARCCCARRDKLGKSKRVFEINGSDDLCDHAGRDGSICDHLMVT